MIEKLKPCPFCGGEALIREQTNILPYSFYVRCGNPDCPMFLATCNRSTKEDAIKLWNRRDGELTVLPSAQPGCEDAVPRTSVEYICRKNTVSTNPYEHKYHDKFIQFMDDPEISDFGRWQHSNGFNTALVAVRCDLDKVPSVTPKQQEEDCDTCKHGYFGDAQCNNCRVRYPSHYEREQE